MAELTTWRVYLGGLPFPGAAPSLLAFCSRTGLALTPQPPIVPLGNAVFGFTPSAAQAAEGVVYLIDNGVGTDVRYMAGTVNAVGTLPIAALNFTNPDGSLFNGAGLPSVPVGGYVSAAGAARTAPTVVPLLGNHLFCISPSQADIDAGGTAYLVDGAVGAEPSSYDGSFSAETGWSYDPAVATDSDRLRLLVGDTNSADRLLLDSEIAWFLTVRADLYLAAADAANAIAAKYSRQADTSNLSLSISASQRAEAYRTLAGELAARAGTLVGSEMFAGGLTFSGKEVLASDTDAVQPSFSIGQDDEPGAAVATGIDPRRW